MSRQRPLAALAITVSFVLTGCFDDSAIGPCTLRVAISRNPGGTTALTPPYRVGMQESLNFSGDGWIEMNVVTRHESGFESGGQLDRQEISERNLGFSFDRPGQWQVRISDRISGCSQEFAVEAVP